MTTQALSQDEKDQRRINFAIRQLQQGRNNAHGTFTLTANDTSTTVTAINCAAGSHVSITPTSATAAAAVGSATGVYVTPGNGSFVVTHNNTADLDRTFTYGIVG